MKYLVTILILFLSSCGIIKKAKTVDKLRDRSKIDITIDSIASRFDTTKTITEEKIEITFKIRKPELVEGDTTPGGSGQQTKKAVSKPVSEKELISDLIDKSEEVNVRIDRKTAQESGIFESYSTKKVKQENRDIQKTEKEIEKESDTTLLSNIPWYVLILLIVISIVVLYLAYKKISVFRPP